MLPKRLSSSVFVFLLFLVSITHAQSIGGAIIGRVRDASGVLPQAEVRITNIATGQSRFWLTDDQGRYELREVPPGLYELKISKDGYTTFSTPSSDSLHLKLAQIANVDDVVLNVAPVSETKVEVHSMDVAMTDTTTATLGTAFEERQIQELPLPARDVNNLAPLAPGVVNIGSYSFANTLVAFAADGSRGRDNNFIIDSVDNNEPVFGGAATQFTNTESFSEFHILTGQFQAEYGRNSGSIVNVISKQGGRDFHGSLFWFGQNDGVNAMTKVEKQSGLTKPARFYENQVGATVSGPISRNSTWFFLSYQFDRARNDLTSEYPVVALMPTPDGLTALKNAVQKIGGVTPSLQALLDDPLVNRLPTLNTPCPLSAKQLGNYVGGAPASAINPCFTITVNLDDPRGAIPFGAYYVPEANVTDLHDHEGFARIDRKFGETDNLFFRYFLDDFGIPLAPSDSPADIGFLDVGLYPEWRNSLADRTQNFGLAWTHSFTRALNEFRVAYSRVSTRTGPPNSDDFPSQTVFDEELQGAFTIGRDSTASHLNNNIYQIQDNYSFIHGRHSIKLGANLDETLSGLNQVPGDLGEYIYDEEGVNAFLENQAPYAGLRFANFEGRGGSVLPLRETAQFYFAQDDIRVSPSVVINLGLRYENYSPTFNAVVDRSAPNPFSAPKINHIYDDFAPRVGFAWGIDPRTVVRGGYGIFYNPTFLDIALLAWQSSPISPYVVGGSLEPYNDITLGPYPNPPFTAQDVTNISGGQGCTGDVNDEPVSALDCATQNIVSKNLRNPFVHSASLGVQRQFSSDFLVEANYFGSRGTRLFQRVDLNPLISTGGSQTEMRVVPDRGVITELTNGGYSNYEALQLSTTKRLHSGSPWGALVFNSAYTWSHTIDNASEIFGAGILDRLGAGAKAFNPVGATAFAASEPLEDPTPFAQNPADTRDGEKGNSSFDRRHRLALDFVWDLPQPAKERRLLGNWGLSGLLAVQSGQPFTPLNDVQIPGSLENYRPDIGNMHAPENTVALLGKDCPNNTACYVTPSGEPVDPSTVRFVQVAEGQYGDAGRNILTGPGTINLDTSIFKTVSITERFKLELRVQAFNAFNRQNPGPLAGNPFLASDQQVASTILQPTGQASVLNSPAETAARISGFTPGNTISATDVPFLSQKYLTTSSRRIQWAIRFSF